MEQLHWFVRASACDRDKSLRVPRSSWLKQPEFKTFPSDLQKVPLPPLQACIEAEALPSAQQLLSSLCHAPQEHCVATSASSISLPLAHISLLLQLSFGITGDHTYKRAAPSSGGLCPSQLYVLWDGALHHFCPSAQALTRLRPHDAAAADALRALLPLAPPCCCTLFVACNLHRTGAKYGDRCYRYVAADVGHIVENARLVALALGLSCEVAAVFDDSKAAAFLGIDGVSDVVMAVLSLRHPAPRGSPASVTGAADPASVDAASAAAAEDFVACCVPEDASSPLGVTWIAHAITSMRRTPSQPQHASLTKPSPGPAPCHPSAAESSGVQLPQPLSPPASTFGCILARRSLRHHSPAAVPPAALHAMLLAILAPKHCISAAVRLHVIVNRAGISPGVYRAAVSQARSHARLDLVTAGSFAAAAQEAALGQDVIGNAAVVLIFSLSCACISAAGPAAGREYRNGYIEAGARSRRTCAHQSRISHVFFPQE
jgi:SagB-type dehydrogenase family enzyme